MAEVWGFAESTGEVSRRRNEAAAIIGEQITNVVYFSLDYQRHELRPGARGVHWVTDPTELLAPTWHTLLCDSLDFGVELRTMSGRHFSITWDPPGWREGMGIRETQFIESVLRPTTDVAAWEVTTHSQWSSRLQNPVASVDLHFLPWGESTDQYWCSRVTLGFGDSDVIMMLGEGTQDGQIAPSSDNIAVLFDQSDLPEWERRPPLT